MGQGGTDSCVGAATSKSSAPWPACATAFRVVGQATKANQTPSLLTAMQNLPAVARAMRLPLPPL